MPTKKGKKFSAAHAKAARDPVSNTLQKEMGISSDDNKDKQKGDQGATRSGGKTVAMA
jgi:hypothetical protein